MILKILKKYWKHLAVFISIVIVLGGSFFAYYKFNVVKADGEEPLLTSNNVEEEKSELLENTNVNSNTFYVDIKGAVVNPGVYQLDEGSRVIDVINLAGGLNPKADTSNLNLSKKIIDEMYIIVYTKTELTNYKKSLESQNKVECPTFECICPDSNNDACISKSEEKKENSVSENKLSTNSKVSINNATKEELMTLTGVGESKANAIINYRKENGNFEKIEDIKNVSGIGDSMFQKIKDNITL